MLGDNQKRTYSKNYLEFRVFKYTLIRNYYYYFYDAFFKFIFTDKECIIIKKLQLV